MPTMVMDFCSFGEKRFVWSDTKKTKSGMTFVFNVEKERLDDVFEKAERRRNEAGIDLLHIIAANIVCAFVSAKRFDSAKIRECFGVVMQHCSAAVEELRRLPLFHERLGSATLMGVTPAQQFSLEAVRSVFSAYVIMVRHDLATSYAAYSAGLDSAIARDDIDWIASCLLGQANVTSKVKVDNENEKTVVCKRLRSIDETCDDYAARLSTDYESSLMTLKGKILFAQLGNNEAGAKCLRLAVARRPNNAGALALLGRCLLRLDGKEYEAVDFLKRSLDNTLADNLAIETVLHYAEALAAVKRFKEAKDQCRRVAELARTKYHRSRVPFYLRKCAESYFYTNKQELAKDLAEEALAKSAELPADERDAVDVARAHSLLAKIAKVHNKVDIMTKHRWECLRSSVADRFKKEYNSLDQSYQKSSGVLFR